MKVGSPSSGLGTGKSSACTCMQPSDSQTLGSAGYVSAFHRLSNMRSSSWEVSAPGSGGFGMWGLGMVAVGDLGAKDALRSLLRPRVRGLAMVSSSGTVLDLQLAEHWSSGSGGTVGMTQNIQPSVLSRSRLVPSVNSSTCWFSSAGLRVDADRAPLRGEVCRGSLDCRIIRSLAWSSVGVLLLTLLRELALLEEREEASAKDGGNNRFVTLELRRSWRRRWPLSTSLAERLSMSASVILRPAMLRAIWQVQEEAGTNGV
mmetsp:Transcript_99216/g.314946  ORF Transcript_99216/g.314946 Transcript_99216/m.314946 type:complete len:260 (+) Transcript_99216:675-1454(+)